jgi:hypothetical protein
MSFSVPSFLIGILVGALLTAVWVFPWGGALENYEQISDQDTLLIPDDIESEVVSVANQPAGEKVLIASVTVPSPGVWVAVREMNGRDFGNVLGAARVSDPRTQFVVPLLRATEPKRLYAVELYRNDNQGNYDPAINSVYVDFDTGKRAVTYFTTTP